MVAVYNSISEFFHIIALIAAAVELDKTLLCKTSILCSVKYFHLHCVVKP